LTSKPYERGLIVVESVVSEAGQVLLPMLCMILGSCSLGGLNPSGQLAIIREDNHYFAQYIDT
jgi:hypothetical protein